MVSRREPTRSESSPGKRASSSLRASSGLVSRDWISPRRLEYSCSTRTWTRATSENIRSIARATIELRRRRRPRAERERDSPRSRRASWLPGCTAIRLRSGAMAFSARLDSMRVREASRIQGAPSLTRPTASMRLPSSRRRLVVSGRRWAATRSTTAARPGCLPSCRVRASRRRLFTVGASASSPARARAATSRTSAIRSWRWCARSSCQRWIECFQFCSTRSSRRRSRRAEPEPIEARQAGRRPFSHSASRSWTSPVGGGPGSAESTQPERREAAREKRFCESSFWASTSISRATPRRSAPAAASAAMEALHRRTGQPRRSAISTVFDMPSHSRQKRWLSAGGLPASSTRGTSWSEIRVESPWACPSSARRAYSSSRNSTETPGQCTAPVARGPRRGTPPLSSEPSASPDLAGDAARGSGRGPGSKRKWTFSASRSLKRTSRRWA